MNKFFRADKCLGLYFVSGDWPTIKIYWIFLPPPPSAAVHSWLCYKIVNNWKTTAVASSSDLPGGCINEWIHIYRHRVILCDSRLPFPPDNSSTNSEMRSRGRHQIIIPLTPRLAVWKFIQITTFGHTNMAGYLRIHGLSAPWSSKVFDTSSREERNNVFDYWTRG